MGKLFAIFVLSFITIGQPAFGQPPARAVLKVSDGNVICSGYAISTTTVVSCGHCFQVGTKVRVRGKVGVVAESSQRIKDDRCVVVFAVPHGFTVVERGRMRPGQVWLAGWANGNQLTMQRGEWSGRMVDRFSGVFRIKNATAYGGQSGGPVFQDGKIVGRVILRFNETGNAGINRCHTN